MKITPITSTHPLWNDTVRFADCCSWKGGQYLAGLMRDNIFRDWERVFIAHDEDKLCGFCTFTKKDEIAEKYDISPFIGCIFVCEEHRGHRISELLINEVISYAKETGFRKVYIMSGETGLYEKYGFSMIGYYDTVFDTTEQLFVRELGRQI
ncbi:MAG TPA: GNAT family N-acetyltransferase [Ruminococcus sp.]|nr:GNAT family N-acetyltransferase [Ruminococcus sp.]